LGEAGLEPHPKPQNSRAATDLGDLVNSFSISQMRLKNKRSCECWNMPIIPALGRLRQKDLEFQANLGYVERQFLSFIFIVCFFFSFLFFRDKFSLSSPGWPELVI
jgi:hypothetical protein